MRLQFPKVHITPIFWNENEVVFASPFHMIKTFAYIYVESPVVESRRFAAAIIKNDSQRCQIPAVFPAKLMVS
jgi:hypothetical protein